MTWRSLVLQNFQSLDHRLTLVADPDGLLLDENLLALVRERGFEMLPVDEPVTFRYSYESGYRRRWDEGETVKLVVIVQAPTVEALPNDLLVTGHRLFFSLAKLFPKLSYPVVKTLDVLHLDPLSAAYQQYRGPSLGDNATRRYLLRHVFGIAPDSLNTPRDLLKLLLVRHLNRDTVPAWVDACLLEQFQQIPAMSHWPLAKLLSSTADFFAFLQARWLDFLAAQQPATLSTRETGPDYRAGNILPLDDPELRGFLNTLFLEGKLSPVPLPAGWRVSESWLHVGLVHQPEEDTVRRFGDLLAATRAALPPAGSPHQAWLRFADQWAELLVTRYRIPIEQLTAQQRTTFEQFHLKVESQFAEWLLDRYHTLHNQPFYHRPVMGHHIAGFLAAYRRRHAHKPRLALVVVDGLAMDQWFVIRQVWAEQSRPWQIEEDSVFAWIPTLTAIARQAIFAGQPPGLFADSWHTTAHEEKHWQRFWQEHSLTTAAIGYARNLGTAHAVPQPEHSLEGTTLTLIENPRLQLLGLVVNTVDNIGHGMQLGTGGMHQQVRQWITQNGYLTRLIDKLLHEDFTVFLTADHGNIWAYGCGRPNEGTLAETKGQRARIYTDPALLDLARQQTDRAITWNNVGLPAGLHILLASKLDAFLNLGDQAVCHGGIALEEVIVPFVQISRKVND